MTDAKLMRTLSLFEGHRTLKLLSRLLAFSTMPAVTSAHLGYNWICRAQGCVSYEEALC